MSDKAETILQAAMMLFAEKGFSATTTRELAQRAEVNEVTLFRHFRSKTELYHQILEEIRRLYPPLMAADEVAGTDPEVIIRDFCLATLRRMNEAPHLLRLMLYAMLEEVDEIREALIEKRLDIYVASLAGAFARLQESGKCQADANPEELARLLMSQVFGLGIMKFSGHAVFDRIDEERLAIQVSRQFLTGPAGEPVIDKRPANATPRAKDTGSGVKAKQRTRKENQP